MRFVDVHGLAGGLSLGLERSGMTMLHRAGLSFGSKNVIANRDHFAFDWTYEHSDDNDPENWSQDYSDVDVVAAVPPCSGFSALSSKTFRGIDSPANACMWSAIRYAARIEPQMVVFESVSAAFTQGRPLMQALREELEEQTGKKYGLYHYKHNGLGVGGSSIRARYFFVASQVPFGVDRHEIDRVPSIVESIGDLANLDIQWEPQEYKSLPSWWSESYRSPSGLVDGHMTRRSLHSQRMQDVHSHINWEPGKDEAWAVKEMYKARGASLPESFDNISPRILAKIDEKDFSLGFNGTMRWRPTRPGYVTTGAAADKIIHPTEQRLLTARELARIQGYPDNWRIEPLQNDSKQWAYWGKNVNARVGEHFGHAAAAALNGTPGEDSGELIGEREYLIDHGGLHKAALKRLLEETEPKNV